jgi:uroporphyrinogen-III synthase
MRILVTRPAEDAAGFVAALRSAGHDAVCSPALIMVPEAGPEIALSRFVAVLITSANAVRALAARTKDRNTRLICVGPASASAARELGFSGAEVSDEEGAVGLARCVGAALKPTDGPLLYPSARDVAGNLERDLTARGFPVRREVVYRMEFGARLTTDAETALRTDNVDLATYFSARSVLGIASAAAASGLTAALERLSAICLSPLVAETANRLHRRTMSAPAPNVDGVLQALDLARRSGL